MQNETPDNVLIKTIGSTVTKVCLYVCITITLLTLGSTCRVDAESIAQCEETCGLQLGVKEVTSTRCECSMPAQKTNPFVLQ